MVGVLSDFIASSRESLQILESEVTADDMRRAVELLLLTGSVEGGRAVHEEVTRMWPVCDGFREWRKARWCLICAPPQSSSVK